MRKLRLWRVDLQAVREGWTSKEGTPIKGGGFAHFAVEVVAGEGALATPEGLQAARSQNLRVLEGLSAKNRCPCTRPPAHI